MVYQLISATPSPYARKVRVSLQEKSIPFELKTEVPWDSTTQTPSFNPLEKLPVLILDDGKTALYESQHILEWLEVKHPIPSMLPIDDVDATLFAKQVQVVADGVCDALVLSFFEAKRGETMSKLWYDRQQRKVEGGLKAVAVWVAGRGKTQPNNAAQATFLIQDRLTIADIAIVSMLGYVDARWPEHHWKTSYPELHAYWTRIEDRQSFADTRPFPQAFKQAVV